LANNGGTTFTNALTSEVLLTMPVMLPYFYESIGQAVLRKKRLGI
jgi:hypothetical protein